MTATAERPLGIRDGDPSGAKFDIYAAEPPSGEWSYILDDFQAVYRRPHSQRKPPKYWPFVLADARTDHDYRAGAKRHTGQAPANGCGLASVLLSPDTEHRAWRNETIHVWPDWDVPHLATADLHLWVRPQGMGGITVYCEARIDLKARTFTLDRAGEDWPAELKAQGEAKAAKVLAFLVAALAERDSGAERPVTAYDQHQASQAQA